MNQLRIYILFALLSVTCIARAETPHWFRWLIQVVDSADFVGSDTAYVRLVDKPFAAYVNTSFSGTGGYLKLPSFSSTMPQLSGHLHTRPTTMVSTGLSYRGYGLSYSRDISKNGDTDLTLTLCGLWRGIEYRTHNSYTLHGDLEGDGGQFLPFDERRGRLRTALINAYYVFQHRKFSHPAATTHTTIQLRSAGSWIASFNYWHASYRSYHITPEEPFSRLLLSHINLGGGYAYNYVFGHQHCLLQVSLTPMFTVWHNNHMYYDGHNKALTQDFSMDVMGHLHFVYNRGRYLTGMRSIFNYSASPHSGSVSLRTVDWQARFFVGVRF